MPQMPYPLPPSAHARAKCLLSDEDALDTLTALLEELDELRRWKVDISRRPPHWSFDVQRAVIVDEGPLTCQVRYNGGLVFEGTAQPGFIGELRTTGMLGSSRHR